jgi:DHA1 family bicyclomycin/chloramphenicol resistance-like MFS transporter
MRPRRVERNCRTSARLSIRQRYDETESRKEGLQWTTAGVVAPIAGLGGSDTAVPMALLMIGGALLSLFGLLVLARPQTLPTTDMKAAKGVLP